MTTVISKNKIPLFSSPIEQKSEKKKTQVAALKDDMTYSLDCTLLVKASLSEILRSNARARVDVH